MRILIISQWFPPEPVKLIRELAETLGERGHEVEVLTGFPNFPAGTPYPGHRQRLWQREVVEGVNVIRVPLFMDHSRSRLKRALNYLTFAASASLLAPFLTRKADVTFVYGTPYTAAIPARVLQLLRGTPFVFNIQDLWPEEFLAIGIESRPVIRAVDWLANWVYRRATKVIAISPGYAKRVIAAGVPSEKVAQISNWVDVDQHRPVGIDHDLRRELGIDSRFVVLFAGSIGPLQGLGAVVDAAALLRDDDVELVFIGDGIDLPLLQARAAELGLTNVRFPGRRPEAEMPRLYAIADALLVHLNTSPFLEITIPHKIFEYMATGKPIVCGAAGDATTAVLDAGAGVACRPGQPQSIAAAIRTLAGMPGDELRRMGGNGRRAACDLYARGPAIDRIAAVLRSASDEAAITDSSGGIG